MTQRLKQVKSCPPPAPPQHAAVLIRHWPFMYRTLHCTVVLSKTHVIVYLLYCIFVGYNYTVT